MGILQFGRLERWIGRRAELWERYDALLAGLPVRLPPPPTAGMRHARHLYRIEVAAEARLDRDALLDRLVAAGIGTGVHYRAVHLHPYYRDRYALHPASLPIATAASERTLSLPLSPKVSDDDQDDVVAALTDALA
jgi:dTDP-4-amino-4,6-dideoxygalactose transaminase